MRSERMQPDFDEGRASPEVLPETSLIKRYKKGEWITTGIIGTGMTGNMTW